MEAAEILEDRLLIPPVIQIVDPDREPAVSRARIDLFQVHDSTPSRNRQRPESHGMDEAEQHRGETDPEPEGNDSAKRSRRSLSQTSSGVFEVLSHVWEEISPSTRGGKLEKLC